MKRSSSISECEGAVYLHLGLGRQIFGGMEITRVRERKEKANGRGRGTTGVERLEANNVVLLFTRLPENPDR